MLVSSTRLVISLRPCGQAAEEHWPVSELVPVEWWLVGQSEAGRRADCCLQHWQVEVLQEIQLLAGTPALAR